MIDETPRYTVRAEHSSFPAKDGRFVCQSTIKHLEAERHLFRMYETYSKRTYELAERKAEKTSIKVVESQVIRQGLYRLSLPGEESDTTARDIQMNIDVGFVKVSDERGI